MTIRPEQADRLKNRLPGKLWRSRLYSYAHIVSRGEWLPYRHLRYLSDEIERTINEDNGRLIISMPPQHGKSELGSVWLPVWRIDRHPDTRLILASYSKDKSAEWCGKARDKIVGMDGTNTDRLGRYARNDLWSTPGGGYMVATSVGGQMTGWSADLIVIDDPVKDWEEANSQTIREKHIYWWESVVETRLQEGASVILIMTRWHERDLAGYFLDQGGWRYVRLPALAEADHDDPLGREPGEALCPARYTREYLEEKRDRTPDMVWSGVYQQRPAVEGGNIWTEDILQRCRYTDLPTDIVEWYQSWDFDFGSDSDESSFVVGQVWACTANQAFLVDQYRARTQFDGMVAAIKTMSQRYPKSYTKYVEDKAAGPLLMQHLDDRVSGLTPVDPGSKSKSERALATLRYWKSGDVRIPHSSISRWVDDYIEELKLFPNGSHDDQVDATTQFLAQWGDRDPTSWW